MEEVLRFEIESAVAGQLERGVRRRRARATEWMTLRNDLSQSDKTGRLPIESMVGHRDSDITALPCFLTQSTKGMFMPILMRAEVHGQTLEGYSQVFNALVPLYSAAPGFVAHISHPIEGGWCVMDVWESRDAFQKFFSQHVVHRLPENVRPKITFQLLHDAFVAKSPKALLFDAQRSS